jgi:hypothetical protein
VGGDQGGGDAFYAAHLPQYLRRLRLKEPRAAGQAALVRAHQQRFGCLCYCLFAIARHRCAVALMVLVVWLKAGLDRVVVDAAAAVLLLLLLRLLLCRCSQ